MNHINTTTNQVPALLPETSTTSGHTRQLEVETEEGQGLHNFNTTLKITNPDTGDTSLVSGTLIANHHAPFDLVFVAGSKPGGDGALRVMPLRNEDLPLHMRQEIVHRQSLLFLEVLCNDLAEHLLDRKTSTLGRQFIMASSLYEKAIMGEFEGYADDLGTLIAELQESDECFWASLTEVQASALEHLQGMARAVTPASGSNRATDKPSAA